MRVLVHFCSILFAVSKCIYIRIMNTNRLLTRSVHGERSVETAIFPSSDRLTGALSEANIWTQRNLGTRYLASWMSSGRDIFYAKAASAAWRSKTASILVSPSGGSFSCGSALRRTDLLPPGWTQLSSRRCANIWRQDEPALNHEAIPIRYSMRETPSTLRTLPTPPKFENINTGCERSFSLRPDVVSKWVFERPGLDPFIGIDHFRWLRVPVTITSA